jgi:hypothetical protein
MLTVLAVVVALVPAGCAAAGTTPGGSPATTTVPTSGAPATSGRPSPGTTEGCPGGILGGDRTLSEKDNGARICLAVGTTLDVYLRAPTGRRWSTPVADSDLLTPVANGRGMLQEGVSAGFFLAAAPGEAHVTAKLDPCGGPK